MATKKTTAKKTTAKKIFSAFVFGGTYGWAINASSENEAKLKALLQYVKECARIKNVPAYPPQFIIANGAGYGAFAEATATDGTKAYAAAYGQPTKVAATSKAITAASAELKKKKLKVESEDTIKWWNANA
jgi:hypothetical protein